MTPGACYFMIVVDFSWYSGKINHDHEGRHMKAGEQDEERAAHRHGSLASHRHGGLAAHRHGGLLWQRTFRLLWVGETVSQVGNAMAMVGVPLVAVTVLHASTFAVTVLTAAAWLPWLVIGLPAGAWVDRLDARRVMIACDVVSATLYASVPITAWAGVLSTGLVVVIHLLAGAASVLFMTAYQVYLPSVVTPAELVEGNTKMQGSASAAAFAGPGLAGLVAQLLGARRAGDAHGAAAAGTTLRREMDCCWSCGTGSCGS
jgi:Transmembrane secretion effector